MKPDSPIKIPGANSVRILGQQRLTMVCPKGHVDEDLPQPMVYYLGNPQEPEHPLQIIICRICMLEFLGTMPARPATSEEMEYIAREKAAQAKAAENA